MQRLKTTRHFFCQSSLDERIRIHAAIAKNLPRPAQDQPLRSGTTKLPKAVPQCQSQLLPAHLRWRFVHWYFAELSPGPQVIIYLFKICDVNCIMHIPRFVLERSHPTSLVKPSA